MPSLEKERQGRIARPKALFFILEIFPRRQAFSHGPFNLILRYRPFAFSSLWPGASVGFLRIGYPRGVNIERRKALGRERDLFLGCRFGRCLS